MSTSSVYLFHNQDLMTLHVAPRGYMERPQRLVSTELALHASKLWDKCIPVKINSMYPLEKLSEEYSASQVEDWESMCASVHKGGSMIDPDCSDIYWSFGSMTAIRTAIQGAVQAVQQVLSDLDHKNVVSHAFALIRPPGHHCFNVPSGFCTANNVVLAARDALAAGKRVAILDWDYHFGDGTAQTFAEDERVMFVSLHSATDRSGNSTYPSHPLKGQALACTSGGRSFNILWQGDDADDVAYKYAFDAAILPALRRFAPDIILVSAGYDALAGDALAGMELTSPVFCELTGMLKKMGIPIVCVLEGGYDPKLLSEGICETIKGLLGEETTIGAETEVAKRHKDVVDAVCEQIKLV